MHLYGRTGLPTPRVQFNIDLPYHLSFLGYQLHIYSTTPSLRCTGYIAHLRPRAPTVPTQQPRQLRHFTLLGMPLGEVLQTLMTTGFLSPLAPRPLSQVVHPHFRMDLHCANHQGPGNTTDQCTALRHAVQDLIDQGIVQLGRPSISSNPLSTYITHTVPPPA